MKPHRVQLSRKKGWKMPANTVKVDRSTPWGNPFIVGKDGTRADCVNLFRLLCAGYFCISASEECYEAQEQFIAHVKAHRAELRGRNLACWCPMNAPCHVDVLLQLANVDSAPVAPAPLFHADDRDMADQFDALVLQLANVD